VLGRWHLINCSFFFVVAGGSGADEVMEGWVVSICCCYS
jgi:hypothetical protein